MEEKDMKSYCDKCKKLVEYTTKEEKVKENIEGEDISYIKKYDICNVCGNIFYSEDTHNYNTISASNELRKKNGIITTWEIEEILKKYNIGKKPLSYVLGWGEVTIIRYLDGQVPERVYSDVMLKVLEDPKEMLKYLNANKDLITPVAYKKAVAKIAELKLEEDKSKIYIIAKHIIAKTGDITPLSLQKILYYIEGFSKSLLDRDIFDSRCEAWVHGPVYPIIYDRFSYYRGNFIDDSEFSDYKIIELYDDEYDLVDAVIDAFGCYSGKTLEKMTHISTPWINARVGVGEDEASNNKISNEDIKKYFEDNNIFGVIGYRRYPHGETEINKYKFKYNEELDCYVCPETGVILPYTGRIDRQGYKLYSDKENCENCPEIERCCKSQGYRVIRRIICEELNENARERRLSEQGKKMYKMRKEKTSCTVNMKWSSFVTTPPLRKGPWRRWILLPVFHCREPKTRFGSKVSMPVMTSIKSAFFR